MALAATTVFELNQGATASNVNAGGFNPSNANMATDLTTDSNTANTASPVASSASYNFVAGDVNHWLYIKSGTNWTPGWYKIASVASNKATLSAAIGAAVQVVNNNFIANTVVGCATVGTPTSGTWTIDYSQTTASPFASTDLASLTGTTNPSTITSVANPFGVNMVGNLIHVTAGTNWTQGWYEIVSVSIITATLDRAVGSSASLTSGTGKVGGAISLGAANDDAVFELALSTSTAASRYFIKGSATYTLGGAVSISAGGGGNTAWPVIHEGYASLRGDRPTGSTRPILSLGSNAFTLASDYSVFSIQYTGSGANTLTTATLSKVFSCKITNTSTTNDQNALNLGSTSNIISGCEMISYRGVACNVSSGGTTVQGCYIHDSNVGVACGVNAMVALDNIIADNVTKAIDLTAAPSSNITIEGNTLYGAENKLGTSITLVTGTVQLRLLNNIIYGFVAGMTAADVSTMGFDDYNNYYNNTADVSDATKWQKGLHDIAVNPSFTNVTQLTGSGASSSTNVLTDAGANFGSVVDNQDFVYLSAGSGTGIALKKYLITAHTTTTLTVSSNITSSGSGSAIAYQVTLGHNFAVGTAMKATGYPGVFSGGLTTGYLDIGGVQRQEAGSGGSFTFGG